MNFQIHLYCHSPACPHCEGIDIDACKQRVAAFKRLSVKLQKCSQCSGRYYCGKDCQVYHWKNRHKAECALFVKSKDITKDNPNGLIPGHTSDRINPNLPAQASAHYQRPEMQTAGHKISTSSRKNAQILENALTPDQRETYELVAVITTIQLILSDAFQRRKEGLPPREKDFLYNNPIDCIVNGTSVENVELWQLYTTNFKSWMNRASNEGFVFESENEKVFQVPHVVKALGLLIEWEPTVVHEWIPRPEAFILTNLCAGIANQKYYLEKMLPSDGVLHSYITLLLKWCDWKGTSSSMWNLLMITLLGGIFVGVEITETKYHTPVDRSLLQALELCGQKALQYVIATRTWVTYKERKGLSDPFSILYAYKYWFINAIGRDAKMFIRMKSIFPNLDLTPLALLAHHYRKESVKFFNKYPMFGSEIVEGTIGVLAEEIYK